MESLLVGTKLCLDPCNCSYEFFVAPRQLLEAGYLAPLQHRVTHLAKVTFVHEKNCPGAGVELRTLTINAQNKFHNKKLQKAQKIGKLVYNLFSVTICVKTEEIQIDS